MKQAAEKVISNSDCKNLNHFKVKLLNNKSTMNEFTRDNFFFFSPLVGSKPRAEPNTGPELTTL